VGLIKINFSWIMINGATEIISVVNRPAHCFD